ncbi:MAG: hypothetical protein COB53_06545 [Elusimicrobia bacterium]|nr:MAG: hypothetical protein COB53_06545 [Elusimicrobiota bacterium]
MKPNGPSKAIKIAILLIWAILLGAALFWYNRSGIGLSEVPKTIRDWIATTGHWGPILFIIAYALRPFTLLPASIPTAAAGLMWGPIWGMVFTLIGENLSAATGFYLARFLGQEWLIGVRDHPMIRRVDRRLLKDGFMTVLILRLVFVPFDLLNFACGLTKMRYTDFAIGTFFGIIPGAFIFVLFGSAWSEPRNLAVSGILFAGSFLLAKVVKNSRYGRKLIDDVDVEAI